MAILPGLASILGAVVKVSVKAADVAVESMDMVHTSVEAGHAVAKLAKVKANNLLLESVMEACQQYGWPCSTVESAKMYLQVFLDMGAEIDGEKLVMPAKAVTPAPTSAPTTVPPFTPMSVPPDADDKPYRG